ncbi:uncharacterized protein BX664DRAFT_332890 [Halteromyces radiatus]|uniref:uncharacterized protein n=1 Tax=Halteromyces radiatus TaxID=101107 RepID=UPI002220CF97|nr:uncharacterized protein BX664DRAFT_332890 [Halteromyces radiatus]KAI8089386.1 hypothetical protein BX664DRAFT_332890 [Halteromyces radiatus]
MVQVAYIGLGKMGYEIANHIANKLKTNGDPPLLVYNRNFSKAQQFASTYNQHSQAVSSLKDISNADVIFSCLFNDEAVQDIIGTQLLSSGLVKQGAIIVEQATISPETAQDLLTLASSLGVHYLSCPVMGPPARAKAASLIPLLSGDHTARPTVLPLIEHVIGDKIIQVGKHNDAGAALRLKLCGNFFVFAMTESIAEGLTLGEATGVGQDSVKALIDTLFANTIYVDYSTRMVDETYHDDIRFTLDGGLKDASHILDLGKSANVDLPITATFKERLTTLQQRQANMDVSGIVGVVRESAGLDFDLKSKEKKT